MGKQIHRMSAISAYKSSLNRASRSLLSMTQEIRAVYRHEPECSNYDLQQLEHLEDDVLVAIGNLKGRLVKYRSATETLMNYWVEIMRQSGNQWARPIRGSQSWVSSGYLSVQYKKNSRMKGLQLQRLLLQIFFSVHIVSLCSMSMSRHLKIKLFRVVLNA